MTGDDRLVQITPSERQLKWQQMEFYAFVHFTVNTFTDKEWGEGTEDPKIFNPTRLDARQWVRAIKAAGMSGLILTCKHHDGFCLWPSRYTDHSVASSPFRGGAGDVVREVSDACHEYGIKFGVYLSPWDRNCSVYGQGRAYDDYYVGQLTEMLTGYGDIFSVWLDGACGEGPNGKKQYYDWDRYYSVIRELAPDACISVCGPDVRWCGNEAGITRECEWSVVPERTKDSETIASKSQQIDDDSFRKRTVKAVDADLGSREILRDEPDLIWYPAEVNTSIRPGWFYHQSEDSQVRSLDELRNIYINSVGGNATFLLNIPPNQEGLLADEDVQRLEELGDWIRETFRENLLDRAKLDGNGRGVDHVRMDDYEESYVGVSAEAMVGDGSLASAVNIGTVITARWDHVIRVTAVVIKENITKSQRVERFVIETGLNGEYHEVYQGTVIGYQKIAMLGYLQADSVRLRILDSREEPMISFIGIY